MTRITRIEVIDENGRSYVNHEDDNDVTLSYQDDGKTLKVFVNKKPKSPAEEAYKGVYGVYPITGIADGSGWTFFQDGYNASKVEEYQPTPQTENEVAEGLKEAFREAQQTEEWKETQRKIDSNYDDMVAELKGQNLYDLIYDWWNEIFVNGNPSGQNIESLVEQIEKWLPKEQSANSQNAYVECTVEGFNDAITKIKNKLK